jgi:dihydrofolate synthase / folylpolyglutamate synthase
VPAPREYLAGLEFHGIKLGLENITALLRAAGDPQNAYPTVHVAGTNGKGSVLAFLDAMLRAAGYKTGRYTSPHLIDVSERFLVSGVPIPDGGLDAAIELFRGIAGKTSINPTYFEMVTAIAFNWFAKNSVDIGLIEVGMGGRFDATNVLHPAVTAITPIDFDHMQYLGHTLEAIAFEKAGILKPSVPVVVGETRDPARTTVLARAQDVGAPVIALGTGFTFDAGSNGSFRFQSSSFEIECGSLGLAGAHQHRNAAVACALALQLLERFPALTREAMVTGLREARWPCRLEQVLDSPPVIIDAGHNPAAMKAVLQSFPRCIAVLAVSGDKDAGPMVRAVERVADRLLLTQYQGRRAMPAEALAGHVSLRPYEICPDVPAAIDRAMQDANLPVFIAGSIFTAGEARRYLIERYGAPLLRF